MWLQCAAFQKAFATAAIVEGTYQIATGSLVSLAEQQLIDCSVDQGNIGCGGGDVSYALQYVLDNKGMDSEDDYCQYCDL